MDIREFRYYQYLAEQGYLESIVCYDDVEHGSMLGNIDENDKLYLWCMSCNYRLYPGLVLEEKVRTSIKQVSKDNLNAGETA